MSDLIQKALASVRESKAVEFKRGIDVSSTGEWCEIAKDIVAMTNSGGGVILFGVEDNGSLSDYDVSPLLAYDPANITNKIRKYCGYDFSDFEVSEQWRAGSKIAAMLIKGSFIPLVFIVSGAYRTEFGQDKIAFAPGTVYFRHGAKSEPGNQDDLRKIIERNLEATRKQWLDGIKKVVKTAKGSQVAALPDEIYESTSGAALPIRIVDDPSAPAYRKINYDETHPYRGKDLLKIVNEELAGKKIVNQHDLLCIRRVFAFEGNEQFCHKPAFSSIQYSKAFAELIVDNCHKDPEFCTRLRREYSEGQIETILG